MKNTRMLLFYGHTTSNSNKGGYRLFYMMPDTIDHEEIFSFTYCIIQSY